MSNFSDILSLIYENEEVTRPWTCSPTS